MKKQDLLLEIGCEELPPKTLKRLSESLAENIANALNKKKINYESITNFATPRRLAVLIENLDEAQPDQIIERRGPSIKAAFDNDGKPTKAALGFAASCGVGVEQLSRLKTEKGEWLGLSQHAQGKKITEIIGEIVNNSIKLLPIAKRMRWGSSSVEFVRPVHWVVLIYGNDIVDAEILGLKAGNETIGHRFHALKKFKIPQPKDYVTILNQQGKVVVDIDERKQSIRREAISAAETVDAEAIITEGLLEEIAAINEWPVPILGAFDEKYLNLPMEVLVTTMQTNQKYFPVKDKKNKLIPYFITFSNIESTRPESIKLGNERVIAPRLADAEFFWKQDRKEKLEEKIPLLKNIVFQQKLGTLADKTERVEFVATHIAIQLQANGEFVKRAAQLAKADLLTEMVGEFASLQGIMGRYYALEDGEPDDVAWALEEQYYPKQAGSQIPMRETGKILAIAEKIDTLCGIFSVGLVPTGDKDPYALRRAAIGILRIIIEGKLSLDIVDLVDVALAQLSHEYDKLKTRQLIVDFIYERLKGYCLDQGYKIDEFESVMAVRPSYPGDFMMRLQAVKAFKKVPEAESLAAANKRINNILKKSTDEIPDKIGGLQQDEEKALLAEALSTSKEIEPLLNNKEYTQALSSLARLKTSVDNFFDHVMVNTEDEALRKSRLALLKQISQQFLQISDISKLKVS